MNILFIGGSSEIAIKVTKQIKKNVYSISRKKSIRYYRKNIQIKNYSENELNFAFKKLKSINFQSVFIFNGYHKTSLLSFFNENLFDKIYLSFEIGFRKPAESAFKIILKENNLNPNEVLFIDDSPQHIETAERLGMNCYYLLDEEDITTIFPDIIL